jgi:GNAT superfamily N-acetyltransferase
MADLGAYYSSDPASGLWILEYGTKFVGLIAIDGKNEGTKPDPVFPRATASHKTANIRHLYVDELYRSTGIALDLLQHGVKQTFSSDEEVKEVRAAESALLQYVGKALKEAGFKVVEGVNREVGIGRWRMRLWTVGREKE